MELRDKAVKKLESLKEGHQEALDSFLNEASHHEKEQTDQLKGGMCCTVAVYLLVHCTPCTTFCIRQGLNVF